MSAGEGSAFPRIEPDDPLAEASRMTNAMAEEVGLEATLKWLGLRTEAGKLAYLGEQRALRAIAVSPGLKLNLRGAEGDERVARAIVATPLWRDMRIVLIALFMDGVAIGWKGRQLAAPAGEPPREAIGRVVDYCWSTEERDYERAVEQGDIEPGDTRHVFTDLRLVQAWLNGDSVASDE